MRRHQPFLPLILTCLCLIFTAPQGVLGQAPPNVSKQEAELIERIELLLDHRDFEEALRLAEEARTKHPNSYEALRVAVIALADTNQLADFLDQTITVPPGDVSSPARAYEIAWAAVAAGNVRLALQWSGRALELDPAAFEIRRVDLVARRLNPETDKDDLLADYRRLVADFPSRPMAHASFLNALRIWDPFSPEMKRAIERALQLEEVMAEFYLQKGAVLEQAIWFDPTEALEVIREGRERLHLSSRLAQQEAKYLRDLGLTEEALDLLQEWREIAPNHGNILMTEISVLGDLGRWDEALSEVEAGLRLTYQPWYQERYPMLKARILHDAGRDQEAVSVLIGFLRNSPTSPSAANAREFLGALQAAGKGPSVEWIPGVPYLQQKGNYCGPATVSMVLGYYGIELTQDQIAKNVYTGIAGTPPQVIEKFANTLGFHAIEFEGEEKTWKQLIDAGFPILWLKMLGRRGAHYYVVAGYDDALKEWIVHNPHQATRSRIGYNEIDDAWPVGNFRRSTVLIPPDRVNDPALQGIAPTTRLLISNALLYVATGSNLFTGLFPSVFVNLLFAGGLGVLLIGLLRRISFPNRRLNPLIFLVIIIALFLPLNFVIGVFRLSEAVSILLALHLAMMSLVPLLALLWFLRRQVGDFLHPRESIGLCLLIGLIWFTLANVDQDELEILIPIGGLMVGLPVLLFPRYRLYQAEQASRYGDATRALDLVLPYGLDGARYFSALCIEMDALLLLGHLERLEDLATRVLNQRRWPKSNRRALEFHRLMAISLRDPERAAGEIKSFLEEEELPARHRPVLDAMQLYIAEKLGRVEEHPEPFAPENVDGLMEGLDKASRHRLAGLAPTRVQRGQPLFVIALLMALSAAISDSTAKGDEQRAQRLWKRYGGRYGLQFRLLKEIGRTSESIPS